MGEPDTADGETPRRRPMRPLPPHLQDVGRYAEMRLRQLYPGYTFIVGLRDEERGDEGAES
jgi:hypothetical protein